jgi:hypothetical protein
MMIRNFSPNPVSMRLAAPVSGCQRKQVRTMQSRINNQFADALEQAVVIDALSGAATAWAFLEAHKVPRDIIARVLSTASVRRRTDTPTSTTIEKCRAV